MNPKYVRSLCRLAGALAFCAGLGVCGLIAANAVSRLWLSGIRYGVDIRHVAFSGDGRYVFGVGTRRSPLDAFGGTSAEATLWRRDLKTGAERAFLLPATNAGDHSPFAVSPDGARVIANDAVWTLPESGTVARRNFPLTVAAPVDHPVRAAWFTSDDPRGGFVRGLHESELMRRWNVFEDLTGVHSLTKNPIEVALAFVKNDPKLVSLTLVIHRDEAIPPASAKRVTQKFPLARIDGTYELHWRGNRLWILPGSASETGFSWQPGETRLRELPRNVVEARVYDDTVSGPGGWVAEINGWRDGPLMFLTRSGPPRRTIPIFGDNGSVGGR